MSEYGTVWSPGKLQDFCCPLINTHTLLLQNYSHWSLLCREEGTWFLAGIRDLPSDCLRPRVFYPLQTHGPWISHVTRGPTWRISWPGTGDLRGRRLRHKPVPLTQRMVVRRGLWGLGAPGDA